MKNNLKFLTIVFFVNLIFFLPLHANDDFTFDITEIEITEGGNKIKGFKGGRVFTEDGDVITAKSFLYNKITNILIASGNVIYENKLKDIKIYSDEVTYLKNKEKLFTKNNSRAENKGKEIIIEARNFTYDKVLNILNANKNVKIIDSVQNVIIDAEDITYLRNKEKIFTKGKTKAVVENNYKFYSKNVLLLRNIMELSSLEKTIIKDKDLNEYELDEFKYLMNEKFLKGKNITVMSNPEKNQNDEYFFSDGFFNLENKSFISKDTKIKIHKNIFGIEKNDPRIYGSSSYGDDDQTVINKGIFTSCEIKEGSCPAWSIKSKKITHDKIKRNIIYDNAFLKIYDIPVFYFPKFFHPDPTVKKRSGFLQPQLNNSKILGSSLYMPYYKVISENKDFTFKPTIFDGVKQKKYMLQNEYRQTDKNSSLIADFSLTKGYRSKNTHKDNSISHLFAKYDLDLKLPGYSQSNIKAKFEKVSNDSYLKVFQNNLFPSAAMPKSNSSLETKIDLYLNNDDYSLSSGFQIYEDLGKKNSDRYQYILPYYNLSKSFFPEKLNGTFDFYSSGSNKLTNTNELTTLNINDLSYQSFDSISNWGFQNNYGFYLKNINAVAKNNSKYKNSLQIGEMSLFEFKSEFPLAKITEKTYNILTPKISFRANPQNNMKNYSNSSKLINADNVFNINRLGISDSLEGGKSLTLGIDYKMDMINNSELVEIEEENNDESTKWRSIIFPEKSVKNNKYLEFKLATVFRDKFEEDIPSSSTINRKNSNIFGSINNHLFENINIGYAFSVDNNLKTIESNEINTTLYVNNFVTTFNFIEQRGELGTTHVLKNSSAYKINENNFLTFNTRRNKEINLTEYYNLSYEYRTDCITAALKFNKVFYADRDLTPSEHLFFTITIIPITKYEPSLYKR